eukprot:4566377-Lingulodinium_polyedra.AAC.1
MPRCKWRAQLTTKGCPKKGSPVAKGGTTGPWAKTGLGQTLGNPQNRADLQPPVGQSPNNI